MIHSLGKGHIHSLRCHAGKYPSACILKSHVIPRCTYPSALRRRTVQNPRFSRGNPTVRIRVVIRNNYLGSSIDPLPDPTVSNQFPDPPASFIILYPSSLVDPDGNALQRFSLLTVEVLTIVHIRSISKQIIKIVDARIISHELPTGPDHSIANQSFHFSSCN